MDIGYERVEIYFITTSAGAALLDPCNVNSHIHLFMHELEEGMAQNCVDVYMNLFMSTHKLSQDILRELGHVVLKVIPPK